MVAQALSMGKEPDTNLHSITDADTAHTVENLKKINFEVLEHPLFSHQTHLLSPLPLIF